MFQKPAFGSTTANFGSFNSGTTTASPFSSFKPNTGTSAFGAPPAFGATATSQPATGGGLFGATNTTGGLFGNNNASTSTSGFGASTSGFGFGASTSTGGGLFGSNTTSTGLFGNTQNQTAFGAKPSGFGFGATSTTGTAGSSLFGATPTTGTSLFGQQNNTLGAVGLFANNNSAFGQPQQTATGTAHVKYNPVIGTDVVVKQGASQNVNIKHHCITCMKEYENKSLEELRLEDYVAGRKGNSSGMFGGFQPTTENKSLFGGTTSFAQPATTSAPSVFGGGPMSAGAFGQPSSFSFGAAAAPAAGANTGLFGANKPAFGTTATTGILNAINGWNQPGLNFGSTQKSLSDDKDKSTSGLASTGFGNTQSTSGLTSTGFGNTQNTFGLASTGFGNTRSTSGLTSAGFGNTQNTFGLASTGFGNTQSTSGLASTGFGYNQNTSGLASTGFGNTQSTSGLASTGFGNTQSTSGLASTGFGNTQSTFGSANTGFGYTPNAFGSTNTGFGNTHNTFGSANTFGYRPFRSSLPNNFGDPFWSSTEFSTNSAFGTIVTNSLSTMAIMRKMECMHDIFEVLCDFSTSRNFNSSHRWDQNRPGLKFGTGQNSSGSAKTTFGYRPFDNSYFGSPFWSVTEASTNSAFGTIVVNALSTMTNKRKMECMQEILETLREFSF
ncbi:unnamed protein product [Arctia plantaginis]|uniref:Nuclear pore complex protein Nup98-Nup96 n=1 Tax=Arctia plantaginis TaxID=874455 RepID=A0A8S0ZWZ6_ARCPL|nr:unnamed protein product [Arctia plantaginis]